ncbi:MAG: hypothetical protein NTX17_05625 [Candidatus Eisenbacteria bacterium]|nr:hypothetical protein [Candidatus Eisenbacteria bacterium]
MDRSVGTFILTGPMLEPRQVQNSSRALNGMVAPFSELEADVEATKK